jgi:type II secretory pathway component PulJ
MNQHSGMANLWSAICLIFITSLLGWITLRSVMSETQRSQQQLFAAQALSSRESLLETAIRSEERRVGKEC